jgi:hypothetical protein
MKFNHGILRSIFNNQAMNWRVALTELIDNALDAGAQRVVIGWKGRRLTVIDDGAGISPEGFDAIYTLGAGARPVQKKTIGRYGVGFKEAAGWLWGTTRITSRHEGVVRRLLIDWDAEAQRGLEQDEGAPTITLTRKPTSDPSFTEISSRDIDREPPNREQLLALIAHLQHVYRPALASGFRIIFLRGKDQMEVSETPWPARAAGTPEVDASVTVAGRTVHVRAYVTAHDQRFPGIHFALIGRHMDTLTTRYQSRRIYGCVTLGAEWEVSKNKTQVSDRFRDRLMDAIEALCRPVLEAAEHEEQTLVLNELALRVENQLNDGIRGAMRLPADEPGIETTHRPPLEEIICYPEDEEHEEEEEERRVLTPQPPKPPKERQLKLHEKPAPRVAIKVVDLDPTLLTNVCGNRQSWLVEINRNHPYTKSYLQAPSIGGHPDLMRMISAAISALAAEAAVNEDIAAAMPWLKDTAQADRYTLACARLWAGYLQHRIAGKELE